MPAGLQHVLLPRLSEPRRLHVTACRGQRMDVRPRIPTGDGNRPARLRVRPGDRRGGGGGDGAGDGVLRRLGRFGRMGLPGVARLLLWARTHAELAGGRQDHGPRGQRRGRNRQGMQLDIAGPAGAAAQLVDPVPGVSAHRGARRRGECRRADHPVHLHRGRGRQTAVLLQQRPGLLVRGQIEEHRRHPGRAGPQFAAQPLPRQRGVAHRGRGRTGQRKVQTPAPTVHRETARKVDQQGARRGGSRTQPRQHRVRITRPVETDRVTGKAAVQQGGSGHHRQGGKVRARRQLHRAPPHSHITRYQQHVPSLLLPCVQVHMQTVLTPPAP